MYGLNMRKSLKLLDKTGLIAYNFKWYILFMDFFGPWESLKDEIMKGKDLYYENIYANKRKR